MIEKTQQIILNKKILEILCRIGCSDGEIVSLLKTGAYEKTGDALIDELLDELIIPSKNIHGSEQEPAPSARGGNHNPNGTNQYSDIETDNKKEVYKHIVANVGKERKDLILITKNFKCVDYQVFTPYITEMPDTVIKSVENWLRKIKLNEQVSVEFITKQFFNFAKRSNTAVFKGNAQ